MWEQGQHVAIVGNTGSGKSSLAMRMLKLRSHVVVIQTKFDTLDWIGYKYVVKASQIRLSETGNRFVIIPAYEQMGMELSQIFSRAWLSGGWTLYIDEVYTVEKHLGFHAWLVKLLTQGRSHNITMVIGAQRPVDLSRFAVTEPRHLLISKPNDERDLDTVREMSGRRYAVIVGGLEKYEFAWLNRNTSDVKIVTRDNVQRLMRA